MEVQKYLLETIILLKLLNLSEFVDKEIVINKVSKYKIRSFDKS